MFSTLRNRFGIPGVISVIALVFAMFGGAYAASNSSGGGKATASAKAKKGPKGPKGAKGDTGAQGPAGPVGPAGPAGAKGDAGGAGAPGVGVTSTESANAIDGHCTGTGTSGKGGSKFVSASGVTYACNGKEGTEGPQGPPGEPWTELGTLPPGETETGTYLITSEGTPTRFGESAVTNISFSIPLADSIAESHTIFVPPNTLVQPECENAEHPGAAELANPEAAPGYLCVFGGEAINVQEGVEFLTVASGPGAGVSGTMLAQRLVEEAPARSQGSWAVTAPLAP
jgi:hypothetical protein